MRVVCCLCLLLTACASHAVRCDGRLQPINPRPAVTVPVPDVETPRSNP
jgi:hypothetical protein